MHYSLSEICQAVQGALHRGDNVQISDVSIDTRTLKTGELFVAIKGENFDGHDFIQKAKEQGAVAVIVSHKPSIDLPYIQVSDTTQALGQLAAWHRSHFDIPIAALTGSCGKTTVRSMTESIASKGGKVLASQGSFNNHIGVPLTLLRLDKTHDYAVLELGANHPGEIATLVQLVQPHIALITNIAPAHLEGFGDIEGVAKAKAEIFQGLPKDGVALLNVDQPWPKRWHNLLTTQTIKTFALDNEADFSIPAVNVDEHGHPFFTLQTPAGEMAIQLGVPGRHNLYNALAAAAIAETLGCSLAHIKAGLERFTPVTGRLCQKQGLQGARIIDDSYNANLSSTRAALDVLAACRGRRIFILGDLAELADATEHHHQQIGQDAKHLGIDEVYTCGKSSRLTSEAFSEASADLSDSTGQHFTEQQALIDSVKTRLNEETTVLVKGSRSAKMENIVAALVESS